MMSSKLDRWALAHFKLLIRTLIGIATTAVVATCFFFVLSLETEASNQQKGLVLLCHAFNIYRANDNVSHRADFHFFSLTTKLIKRSVAHPQPGQPKQTKSQKEQTEAFNASLEASAAAKTWTFLTPCQQVVDHPTILLNFNAVPFDSKIKPPKSVFKVGIGQ